MKTLFICLIFTQLSFASTHQLLDLMAEQELITFDDSLDEALGAATNPAEDKVAEVIEDEDIVIEEFEDD